MTETNDAFEVPLLAIFAAEAQAHLAHIDAGLAALAQHGAPAQAALASILAALHTLGGAAHAVALDELEWVCHALERVFMAAASCGARFDGEQRGRLQQAVDLARLLAGQPDSRTRGQVLAVVAQLDAIARQVAAPASA